jgi:hypothetical protein
MRDKMKNQIEKDYVVKKKAYPEEVPKYLKITKIDLSYQTFKQVYMIPKIISEQKMNEYLTEGLNHDL